MLSHVQQGWLSVMAEEANDEHARAVNSIDDALYHMKKSGDALAKVKGELAAHRSGSFLKWVKANFDGGEQIAYRYMVVAAHYDEFRDRLVIHSGQRNNHRTTGYYNLAREITARETAERRALREAEEQAEQDEIEEFLGTEPEPESQPEAESEPERQQPPPEPEPERGDAGDLFQPTVSVAEVTERQQTVIERDEVYLLLTVLEGLAKLRALEQEDVVDSLLAYEHRDACLADIESLDLWLQGLLKAVRARLRKKLAVVE